MRISDLPSLPELIRQAASEFGAAPALQSADASGEGLTYVRLLELMDRGCSTLGGLDMSHPDRVLLVLEPRPEWAASLFAILGAGLVAVPLPHQTPPEAVAAVAARCRARAAVYSDRTAGIAAGLAEVNGIPLERLFAPGSASGGSPEVGRQDPAVLAFTSGSTQRPRAVELSHGNLLSNLDSLLQVRRVAPGDGLLSMLPPAHLFELVGGLLGPLACGARVVYATALLPNRIVKALRVHRITHALAVPALVGCLYEEVLGLLTEAGVVEPEQKGQGLGETARRMESEVSPEDLGEICKGVRSQIGEAFGTLIVGGAAVDPAMAKILSPLGIRVEAGYGLTEASPIVSVGYAGECPPGSVGRPLPGIAVRIGEDDEIQVRGPNVMQGYWEDRDGTAAVLEDGWLKTGDRGRLDDDGYLFVTGRLKEAMITAAGETIYPEEVEACYCSPLFGELCVTALVGEDGNDVPTLFVVPAEPDLSDDRLDEVFADLRAAAPARLRVDRMVRLPHPLPRTATGKVRRRALSEELSRGEGA